MPRSRKYVIQNRAVKWCRNGFVGLLLIFLGFSTVEVLLFRIIDPPFTVSTAIAWLHQKITDSPYSPPRYRWRDLEEISPHVRQAILAAEDQRFLAHHGFDMIELKQAIGDIFSGKRIRGASTISMQTARTLFLWPDRTVTRKLFEAYYTVLIELFWPKRRILEIYLNTVDWGRGNMGIDAAARAYFQVHPMQITRSQSAFLAAVLPAPSRWSPVYPNLLVREKQRRILKDMSHMPKL